MPCRDYYDDHPHEYYEQTIKGLREQVSFAESALCATLRALDELAKARQAGDFYNLINYSEAGITKRKLVDWHTKHLALDAKHRAEERRRLHEEQMKEVALSKLTAEERKILGIK